ncbi:helix-turn-helix domain-containing protein [Streptomyces sp. NPDC056465]|uniref:helix-turn-helix domain-containing protein n=1 Tax=unclassified Streptomyces TaxID=2593676 RepID=UPI0035DFC4A5
MSSTLTIRALNASADLRPTERLLLVFLADDADPDGVAYPSISRLASRANISTSTVTSSMSRLGELGLIQRHQSRTPSGASAPSVWNLTLGTSVGDGGPEARA